MTIPPTAAAIIQATADEYGVTVEGIFTPWPGRSRDQEAARSKALSRLRNETLDGRPRWTVTEIAGWFGIDRRRAHVHMKRDPEFTPRFKP